MCVYLHTTFQVSSTILTSFRQGVKHNSNEFQAGGNFTPSPTSTSKRTPKEPTQINKWHKMNIQTQRESNQAAAIAKMKYAFGMKTIRNWNN